MFYKDFIQKLRNFELNHVYIVVHDLSPHLKKLIQALEIAEEKRVPFHAYYGDIKNVITAFITFWEDTIDQSIKIADEISHCTTKTTYLELVEQSINIQKSKQIDFGKEFLPVTSLVERTVYDELNKKYDLYIESLYKKRELLEDIAVKFYPNQAGKAEFVNDDMKMMLTNTGHLFEFTNDYIGMTLIDHIYEVRLSLEDIRNNVNNDLRCVQTEIKETIEKLHHDLFLKSKEQIWLMKQKNYNSMELEENKKCQFALKRKIDDIRERDETLMLKLKEELSYWEVKIKDIGHIEENSKKLKSGNQSLETQEIRNHDILENARTLVTHFAIKGFSKNLYKDRFGVYYMEPDHHKLYLTQQGETYVQDAATGTFKKTTENKNLYHFDKFGRYYIDDDKKVYNRYVGSSYYHLDDVIETFQKVAPDGTHTQTDLTDHVFSETGIILPSVENINIKATLDPEITEYIWNCFGSILHDALYDVFKLKPKNPFHCLAHRLLVHKYGRTRQETQMKQDESARYKSDILKKKYEKMLKEHILLKSNKPKRAKPEDLDDVHLWQTCDAHLMNQELINAINTDDQGYM